MLNIGLNIFTIAFVDARRHGPVEVRNRLATVLLVLIRLQNNSSQSSIATNALWRTQKTVAGREAAVIEQHQWVSLATG